MVDVVVVVVFVVLALAPRARARTSLFYYTGKTGDGERGTHSKRRKKWQTRYCEHHDKHRGGDKERLKAEAEAKKAEEERLKAEAEAKKAEGERLKAEAEAKKAEEKRLKPEAEAKKKAEGERLKAEAEESRLFPLTKHSPPAAATCACSNENQHGEEVRHDAFSNMRRRLHPKSDDYEHNSPASASSAHRSLLVRWLAAPRNAAQLAF